MLGHGSAGMYSSQAEKTNMPMYNALNIASRVRLVKN